MNAHKLNKLQKAFKTFFPSSGGSNVYYFVLGFVIGKAFTLKDFFHFMFLNIFSYIRSVFM
jgi:hypothetical protein